MLARGARRRGRARDRDQRQPDAGRAAAPTRARPPASLRTIDGVVRDRAAGARRAARAARGRYGDWLDGGIDALYGSLGARDFLRGRRVAVDGTSGRRGRDRPRRPARARRRRRAPARRERRGELRAVTPARDAGSATSPGSRHSRRGHAQRPGRRAAAGREGRGGRGTRGARIGRRGTHGFRSRSDASRRLIAEVGARQVADRDDPHEPIAFEHG